MVSSLFSYVFQIFNRNRKKRAVAGRTQSSHRRQTSFAVTGKPKRTVVDPPNRARFARSLTRRGDGTTRGHTGSRSGARNLRIRFWLTRARCDGYRAASCVPGSPGAMTPSAVHRPTRGSGPNEAHVSTEPDSAPPRPRLPLAHKDPRWPTRAQAPSGQGTEAAHSVDSVEARVIPPTGAFPREARIRRSREFQVLGQRGRRYSSRAFVVLVGAGAGEKQRSRARLGITASRRVGNAVVRNRVKRCIREWFRREGQSLLQGRDVVVIARPPAADLGGAALFADLARVARSIA